MRNYISLLGVLAFTVAANAQDKVYVHLSDNTDVEFELSKVTEISFVKYEDAKVVNFAKLINGEDEMEYVDLGLSVKWGNMNLGATSVGKDGAIFQMGHTLDGTPGYSYDEDELIASYYLDEHGVPGANYDAEWGIAGTQYDAATAALGDLWRMPTQAEWNELHEKCDWEYVQEGTAMKQNLSGDMVEMPVGYYKVTSKVPGFTDKFIIVRATYFKRCMYWTANPNWVGGRRYGIAVDLKSSTNVMYTPVSTELQIRPVYGAISR